MNKSHILVVGASSAIGCETIRQIGSENDVVLAHYRSGRDRIGALQDQVPSRIVPVHADLSLASGVDSLLEKRG